MNAVMKVLNSHQEVNLFDVSIFQIYFNYRMQFTSTIRLVAVKPPSGQGAKNIFCRDRDLHIKWGQHLMLINNNDKLCLARALVTAQAHAHHKKDKTNREFKLQYDQLGKYQLRNNFHQTAAALTLMQKAGLNADIERMDVYFHLPKLIEVIQKLKTQKYTCRHLGTAMKCASGTTVGRCGRSFHSHRHQMLNMCSTSTYQRITMMLSQKCRLFWLLEVCWNINNNKTNM